MSDTGAEIAHGHEKLFKQYKREVREDIDNRCSSALLRRRCFRTSTWSTTRTARRSVSNSGRIRSWSGYRASARSGRSSTWRSPHGYRWVTGVPYPLDVNSTSMDELTAIPGIVKCSAYDIGVDRPYERVPEIEALGRFVATETLLGTDWVGPS